ncbi:unnamed protein product [Paramecium octaurelia]|uniref:Uncharacterized protein n=1 Tax=Paramecium octaurelia TaxID=43137 RepID=A0A8S1YIS7_PAROT|nr:unnamed protein product [Paramecium octaurelia]
MWLLITIKINQLNPQLAEKLMIAQKHQKKKKKPLVAKIIKIVDLFSNKCQCDINSFAYVYEVEGITSKINYNTQRSMKIQWIQDVNIQTIPYDPVLVTQVVHQYLAMATTAIQFTLSNEPAQENHLSSTKISVTISTQQILMQPHLFNLCLYPMSLISSEQIYEIVPSPYLAEIKSFSFRKANKTSSYCFGKQWEF